MAKLDRGGAEEKWEDPGLRGLLEVVCSHGQ